MMMMMMMRDEPKNFRWSTTHFSLRNQYIFPQKGVENKGSHQQEGAALMRYQNQIAVSKE